MPQVGLELKILVFEPAESFHASDRAAAVIYTFLYLDLNLI
jgi:hypothetical protein